jgi:hypothetical protein
MKTLLRLGMAGWPILFADVKNERDRGLLHLLTDFSRKQAEARA